MPIDVCGHEYKTIDDLLASDHELTIIVAIVTASGSSPTDLYAGVLTCLVETVKVDSTQRLRSDQLVQYPVMLHHDSTQPVYPCRFLNRCAAADFEPALESLVTELVTYHPTLFPPAQTCGGSHNVPFR